MKTIRRMCYRDLDAIQKNRVEWIGRQFGIDLFAFINGNRDLRCWDIEIDLDFDTAQALEDLVAESFNIRPTC